MPVLASCTSPTDFARPDEDGRIIGTIEHYGDPVRLDIPSEVAVRSAFRVTVGTYGGRLREQGRDRDRDRAAPCGDHPL